jgi:hypothetical protein
LYGNRRQSAGVQHLHAATRQSESGCPSPGAPVGVAWSVALPQHAARHSTPTARRSAGGPVVGTGHAAALLCVGGRGRARAHVYGGLLGPTPRSAACTHVRCCCCC